MVGSARWFSQAAGTRLKRRWEADFRSVRVCRCQRPGQAGRGPVTLVGAGQDPDLLTITYRCAPQDADVVFYDELVSPEVLSIARDAARAFRSAAASASPASARMATNRLMIEAAKSWTARGAADKAIPSSSAAAARKSRRCAASASPVPSFQALPRASALPRNSETPLTYRHGALAHHFPTAHTPGTPRPSTGRR